MWLLVGLGNPGPRYESNRHSIGFRVVDELARRHGIGPFKARFSGEIASGAIHRHKVLLLKPMQFMNLSGFAVQQAAQFHQIEVATIAVVHDEIDLPLGRIRLKSGGGHGGHNGVRSMIEQLGGNGFARVRVGVGKPGRPEVVSHVLGDFPAAVASEVAAMVNRAADALEGITAHGIQWAMNKFNVSEDPKTA